MSKLTQGHINTLVEWMKRNIGEPLNVSGTWKLNGYEVLNGYNTIARQRAYKLLEDEGYEVDKVKGCVVSSRKFDYRIKGPAEIEDTVEEEPMDGVIFVPPEKVKTLSQPYLKPITSPKLLFSYTDVTQDNIGMVTDSIRGAINIGSRKARIKVSVEYCEGD